MTPVETEPTHLGQLIVDLMSVGAQPTVVARMACLQLGRQHPTFNEEQLGSVICNLVKAGAPSDVIGRFLKVQVTGDSTQYMLQTQQAEETSTKNEQAKDASRRTKKFTIQGKTSVTINTTLLDEFLAHWDQKKLRSILESIASMEVPEGQSRSYLVRIELEKRIKSVKPVLPHGLSLITGGNNVGS